MSSHKLLYKIVIYLIIGMLSTLILNMIIVVQTWGTFIWCMKHVCDDISTTFGFMRVYYKYINNKWEANDEKQKLVL